MDSAILELVEGRQLPFVVDEPKINDTVRPKSRDRRKMALMGNCWLSMLELGPPVTGTAAKDASFRELVLLQGTEASVLSVAVKQGSDELAVWMEQT